MFRSSFLRSSFGYCLLMMTFTSVIGADLPIPQLLIDPSSTKTSLAKCDLIVGPLTRKDGVLRGTYSIKVTPFVFKNDRGELELTMSDVIAEKMAEGEAVEFSGMAVSAKDGKKKPIKGKTQPVANDHGAVNFTVTTEDGDLLFNSSYKITTK